MRSLSRVEEVLLLIEDLNGLVQQLHASQAWTKSSATLALFPRCPFPQLYEYGHFLWEEEIEFKKN
jgi:hypothetical protein